MTNHSAFIEAIQHDPSDDAVRLVYADWLEEHDQPDAADYLRAELELAKLKINSAAAPALRDRLWQAWSKVDAPWLATFTQPQMLRANPTPFPSLWINFDLGKLRPGENTYDRWPYESLPPVANVGPMDGFFAPDPSNPSDPKKDRSMYKRVEKDVAKLGVSLPPAFVKLMKDGVPQFALRSPTDCFFSLPDDYTRVRRAKSGEAVHVHFFCDSQSCVLWDLYIHSTGAHCVIARDLEYFGPLDPEDDLSQSDSGAWFVAPSLEAFIRRIWIENNVWYQENPDISDDDNGDVPTVSSKVIDDYIAHYRRKPRKRKPRSKT